MSLLPAIVDQLANTQPTRRFALVAEHVDSTESAKDVSWSDFRRAVDKTAAWIESKFGRPEGRPALGFLSTPYDFRYSVFALASIKAGYKIFLPSPRNSPEFHTHLINKICCDKFVSSQPLGGWASSCTVIEPPALDELLDPAGAVRYPYNKTWEQAKNDEIIVVHSSGSTGPPKPIAWTNGWINAMQHILQRKSVDFFQQFHNDSRLLAMPQFHTAGLLLGPIFTILTEQPMTLFPSKSLLTAGTLTQFLQHYSMKTAFLPPSILEDMSVDPVKIQSLAKLTTVAFGGGPVAPEAGKALSRYTHLVTGIGSSEAGMYPMMMPDLEDTYLWWQFEDLPGLEYEPQDDGLFELVFRRQEDFEWPVFHVFPNLDAYHTNDLYQRHPTNPLAWKLISRKDDVLVLSNGEKVVPLPMEDVIRLAPEVNGVLYSGHGKFNVAAVIELHEDVVEGRSEDEIMKALGPYLDKANAIAPGFARLAPNMIVFTSPDKPMKRTPKGSFIRKAVLKDYADEMQALYSQDDDKNAVKLVQGLDEAATVSGLTDIFTALSGKFISPEEDLFQSAGIDSMQVLSATRILRASVKAENASTNVTPGLIYDHPTLKLLAQAIRSLVINGAANNDDDRVEAMDSMLLKYTEGLITAAPATQKRVSPENVILTGSTGSLGGYMLDILIKDSSIKRIYALNRSDGAQARQASSNASRGLATDFSKVDFLTADVGSKYLGLPSADIYTQLVESTDMIIHNAWSVNFNQALLSFEPHIRGVRNFIDLAATSPRNPHIVFISSIGTTSMWDAFHASESRPETLLRDARVAAGQGYGEGKYVSEHLLNAAVASGVSATIARVGQVGGPIAHGDKGVWNKQEWLPSIIASSKYLGLLPKDVGNDVANWIPVDSMAQAVVQLGVSDMKKGFTGTVGGSRKAQTSFAVYNLVNPKGGKFSDLIQTVRKHMPEIKGLVSFEAWVLALRASTEDEHNDANANPATKLLDFYEGLVGHGMPDAFDTDKAVANSKTMAELDAVKPEWMDIWMKQWNF